MSSERESQIMCGVRLSERCPPRQEKKRKRTACTNKSDCRHCLTCIFKRQVNEQEKSKCIFILLLQLIMRVLIIFVCFRKTVYSVRIHLL